MRANFGTAITTVDSQIVLIYYSGVGEIVYFCAEKMRVISKNQRTGYKIKKL